MKQELASYGPYRVGDLVDISMEPVDVEVLSGTERFLTVSWPWYVTDARRELEA